MFLAVIETNYTTYAIGETEEEAKKAATESAWAFLKRRGAAGPGSHNPTKADMIENLGLNCYEVPLNKGIQEY